jgi:uncharacterized protein (DUF486 family)
VKLNILPDLDGLICLVVFVDGCCFPFQRESLKYDLIVGLMFVLYGVYLIWKKGNEDIF